MTWWARTTDPQRFEVLLSIGLPGSPPRVEGSDHYSMEGESVELHFAIWRQTVVAAIRATLSRGGTVVAGFDPDLFPLLVAVALEYSDPLLAKHGEVMDGAPLNVVVTSHTLEQYQPSDPESEQMWRPGGFQALWEGTGAVAFVESPLGPDDRGRVPLSRRGPDRVGDSYGLAIWPDDTSELDVESLFETRHRAVLRRPGAEVTTVWGEYCESSQDVLSYAPRRDRSGSPTPYSFLIQRVLDGWLDRQQEVG